MVIVLRIRDEAYISILQRICREEGIDALISTIDTDLLLLSQHKTRFGRTWVVISSEDKIALCKDKRFTAEYSQLIGLKSPNTVDDWQKYNAGYSEFIKPKDGSSSIFAYKVKDEDELKRYAAQVPDYISQPFIEGTEYIVDIFCDFDGETVFIALRICQAVRTGEVLKTQIR